MKIDNLTAGQKLPEEVNVIIEIPSRSDPVKYELDKNTGLLTVDRFVATGMSYPCDYGFIPQTLSEDGDPVDVLVVSPYSLHPGVLIRCRPIGLLRMTDESGKDAKILAVPILKLTTRYQEVHAPKDLGADFLASVEYFFQHYKDLESGKWVKLDGWEECKAAHQEILSSVTRYQKKHKSD